jgi:hypothetical protein
VEISKYISTIFLGRRDIVYKSRKPIALFLTVMLCITLVTAHYSKTQVHGVTETIVAPYVLDAVAKLLVVVSGAYLVDYLNENYDMELERSDVTQTITAVKTLFDIFRTTDGFKLMDKQTGEELSISADTSSVAGHMITGTTPDDAHDRAFYQWYNQNVSKKLGQYHIRVRQWSDTYGQYIDQFHAADNPLQLHQYVPTEYKDDFLQLFADMQEMVKSGFESNGYEKGFISSSGVDVQLIESLRYILFDYYPSKKGDYSATRAHDYYGALEKYDNMLLVSTEYYEKRDFCIVLYNGSLSYDEGYHDYYERDLGRFLVSSNDFEYDLIWFGWDGQNLDTISLKGLQTKNCSLPFGESLYRPLENFDAGTEHVFSSTEHISNVYNMSFPNYSDYLQPVAIPPSEEESSPVTLPLFPPVVDDSGNVALDHGDVQEVPVEEDQDGVPFVPDDWWTSVFDDFYGQTIPGDYDGSLTDMTQTQLLQEIASNTKPPNFTIIDFDAIYEKLKEKFGMFYQIKEFFEAIMNEDYSNPQRPQFTITFTGQLGIYGTYEYLNLDLYDQYRDYIFAFIVATGWFVTLKRIFGYIPKVLN